MLPAEVLSDMLLFLTRNDVDAAQLVSRTFNAIIDSATFETTGPMRPMDLTVLNPAAAALRYASVFYRFALSEILPFIRNASFGNFALNAGNEEILLWFRAHCPQMAISEVYVNNAFHRADFADSFLSATGLNPWTSLRFNYITAQGMPRDIRRALGSPAARSCVEVQLCDQFTATTDEIEWWLHRDHSTIPATNRALRRTLSLVDCNVEGDLLRLLCILKEDSDSISVVPSALCLHAFYVYGKRMLQKTLKAPRKQRTLRLCAKARLAIDIDIEHGIGELEFRKYHGKTKEYFEIAVKDESVKVTRRPFP